MKYKYVLFFVFFLFFKSIFAIENIDYSPSLFAELPQAQEDISVFLKCRKLFFLKDIKNGEYKKRRALDAILFEWFDVFLNEKYQNVLRRVSQGEEVYEAEIYYNEVKKLIQAAYFIIPALYIEELKNPKFDAYCPIHFKVINNYIEKQYSRSLDWMNTMYLFMTIILLQ